MEREKLFDLLVVAFIVVAGLFTAYITFGILQSQAQAQIQRYSVGGAIAGALISWSLLASVYLQIRKSSQELQTLRDRNQELQQKLIRGAPRPTGFEIEVAEQQRIVLARPKGWERRGGIIFDFELPEDQLLEGDVVPARFICSFVPITKDTEPKDQYYVNIQQSTIDNAYIESHTSEFVYLGGEPRSIESLKLITHQYVRVTQDKDGVTGKVTRNWEYISKDEFIPPTERPGATPQSATLVPTAEEKPLDPTQSLQANGSGSSELDVTALADTLGAPETPPLAEEKSEGTQSAQGDGLATPESRQWDVKVLQMYVVCYHEDLSAIFFFEFVDDVRDFARSSAAFNQVLTSTRFLT